jgi:aminoglycoside phosphotransferase (APT) family kinase protein
MSSTLPPLIDEAALEAYLDDRLPGEGPIGVQRHQAGHSNETFFLSRGDHDWVLRRPPLGAFLPSAHDVLREFRVLDALKSTVARVPRTLLACEDESVIGAPFYLMEKVDGVVIRDQVPDAFTEEHRGRIGDELVDALVELHSVDPAECGLDSFAKPTGYLERQLRRWNGQLELTIPHSRPQPRLEEIGMWLRDKLPETQQTAIVQGDYKLDNVMFVSEPPARLVAILDWEMSTLGDPIADLGWMISFWREPDDMSAEDLFRDASRVTEQPGFRARTELVERYAAATGRDVSKLPWYIVLAIWKLAILLEGSYARHLAGMTDDPFFAQLEVGVPALAERALEVMES